MRLSAAGSPSSCSRWHTHKPGGHSTRIGKGSSCSMVSDSGAGDGRMDRQGSAGASAPVKQVRRARQCLLDADLAHHLDVGDAGQYFFDAIHLQRQHAVFQRGGQQLGHAAMFLQQLLDLVGADHQFVQADPAPVALVALGAADRAVQGELAVGVGVALLPAGQHRRAAGRRHP